MELKNLFSIFVLIITKNTVSLDLSNINNLLIIRLSSLGDILLTTPLIRSIKKQFPKIQIDFLLKEQYTDLLRYNPYINEILFYTEDNLLLSKLIKKNYGLVIDLQNNFRSNSITKKLNKPVKKFYKRSVDKFLLVNFKINRLRNASPVPVRYAETVPGILLDDEGLDLFVPDYSSSGIIFHKKNIGFAPGSRHFTKMWPKESYIELGNHLINAGYNVFIFGGKSDREICREISGLINKSVDLSNDDQILQTAADMKNCAAVVCNDSGLMHTACAVKVPVLSFFGSTVKEFGFIPYKNKNLILENKLLSCRPCSHIGRGNCPKGHFRCMLELTPQLAFDNLKSLLGF